MEDDRLSSLVPLQERDCYKATHGGPCNGGSMMQAPDGLLYALQYWSCLNWIFTGWNHSRTLSVCCGNGAVSKPVSQSWQDAVTASHRIIGTKAGHMLSISQASTEPPGNYDFTALIELQPPISWTVNIKRVWHLWSRVGLPPVITRCSLFTVTNMAYCLLGQGFTHIFSLILCFLVQKLEAGQLADDADRPPSTVELLPQRPGVWSHICLVCEFGGWYCWNCPRAVSHI